MANCEKKSQKKLWIGNLDKRLTEYNLLKIVQCYGEIENFEYLFHTTGPNKGEPRSFCFVEYKRIEDANKAIERLNGKKIMSHAVCVRWANKSALGEEKAETLPRRKEETCQKQRNELLSRDEKIKAIEQKLILMQDSDKCKKPPVVFRGKHPMLVKAGKQTEINAKKDRAVKRRIPYSTSKNANR